MLKKAADESVFDICGDRGAKQGFITCSNKNLGYCLDPKSNCRKICNVQISAYSGIVRLRRL